MVDWVKLSTNAFTNKKIRIVRSCPDGDSLALLWFNLICLAGETNDNGYVYVTDDVAYSVEMLAGAYGYDVEVVQRGLDLFVQLKMIEVEENGYIYILGWEEHQNAEELAKLKARERSRKAMRKKRSCEKDVNVNTELTNDNVNVDVNADVNTMLTPVNVNNVNTTLTSSNVNVNTELTNADVNTQNKNKNKNIDINHHLQSTDIENKTDDLINDVSKRDDTQLVEAFERTFGPIMNDVTAAAYEELVTDFDRSVVLEALQRTRENGGSRPGYAYKVAESIVAERNKSPAVPSRKNDVQAAANAVIARIKARGGT